MSLDEVIKWEDKLPTCDESQCDWNAPADKILVAPCDEQTELTEAVSKSDEDMYHKAKPNIKILDILKFTEYFANLRSLFKKNYTEILSDILTVEEKFGITFLLERETICFSDYINGLFWF